MKKIVVPFFVLAAAVGAALALTPAELSPEAQKLLPKDQNVIVHFKDGTKKEGVIERQTDKDITLRQKKDTITFAWPYPKDKIAGIDGFHRDFLTGFKQTTWWDNHRKINRHHLLQDDGVPADVNLVDVLDMIVDCVMAGMARTGSVYPLDIKPEVRP